MTRLQGNIIIAILFAGLGLAMKASWLAHGSASDSPLPAFIFGAGFSAAFCMTIVLGIVESKRLLGIK